MKSLAYVLAIAALFIWAGVAVALAQRAGFGGPDLALRFCMALTGLGLAFCGNLLPKAVYRTPRAQETRRFSGWAIVLAGLVFAALWAFAPLPYVFGSPLPYALGSMAVLCSALIAVFVFSLWGSNAARIS